jgi:hypothetical protein
VFSESLPADYNAFVYLMQGDVTIQNETLPPLSLALLGPGEGVEIEARAQSRLLLVAGRPLGEPIARRGPFVMNNEAQLRQAFEDYQAGRF